MASGGEDQPTRRAPLPDLPTAAPPRSADPCTARLFDLLAPLLPTFTPFPLQARDEAVFEKAYGKDLFNRDAPSYMEEGTRENPIPILSTHAERVVGISLPDEAETRWFTLRKGELCYDPDTMNFFALKQVSQDEVNAWVSAAEKKVLGGK